MFSVHHKSGKIIEYCAHTAHSICGNCIIITVNCNHLFILVSSFKILIYHNLFIEVSLSMPKDELHLQNFRRVFCL